MRSDEFISKRSSLAAADEEFEKMRLDLPLGVDSSGNIVYSHKYSTPYSTRFTCVTGGGKTAFIKRALITASCLYERSEVCFLVLSPNTEYGELLRLKSMDVTVPYIRSKSDLERAKACVKELTLEYARTVGCPKLFLVLDGLEELSNANENGDLEEYRIFLEELTREKNVAIVSGVELMKSIFSGNPGVFVGVGNCLITTREEGRADVTYVGDDSSLSMPVALQYPDSPSVLETIIQQNAANGSSEEV